MQLSERLYQHCLRYSKPPFDCEPEDVACKALELSAQNPYDPARASEAVYFGKLMGWAQAKLAERGTRKKRKLPVMGEFAEFDARSAHDQAQREMARNAVQEGSIWRLTKAEARALQALAEIPDRRQAADALGCSIRTFDFHINRIRKRLGVKRTNTAYIVIEAARQKLVEIPGLRAA